MIFQVLKYFKKSENNKEIGRVGRKWHATGGPMTVERFVMSYFFISLGMSIRPIYG